jgi:tRNA(Ile)-lysidine synthase
LHPFEKKIKTYIQENRLLSTGDTVYLGLSGGADSVCLFFILLALQKEYDLKLFCIHVNHGIRETAARDEAFVKALTEKHGVDLQIFREDIPGLAKEEGISLEEAGRQRRYEIFQSQVKAEEQEASDLSNQNGVKVALAHHLDDQAETVLYRLMRGTGIKGLGGMAPQRDFYIRPLLQAEKSEILAYLKDIGQIYVEDETNIDTAYDRNYIRHELLPQMSEAFHDKVNQHLARTAEMAREAEEVLEELTAQRFEACKVLAQDGVLVLSLERLHEEKTYIYHRILMEAMRTVAGREKDIGYVHMEEVEKLLRSSGHGKASLHYGVIAEKQAAFLFFYQKGQSVDGLLKELYCKEKELPTYLFDRSEPAYEKKMIELSEADAYTRYISADRYTQNFDYDKIKSMLCWRHRQAGDYLVADQQGHSRSLKEYLIDQKIPESLRDDLWLLAAGQEIVWIPGFRISESVKITKETKQVLQIKVL